MEMSTILRQKIVDFLKAYIDLYGSDVFLDEDRIEKLRRERPALSMFESPKKKRRPMTDTEKTGSDQKPDTPLWNFMREIRDCKKCPLYESRTKFVFGEGNEHARLMFVGEAPGADEDRTGRPFVGRAGQLLNKMLKNIDIDREDVFITNILKCRPPNNRDPEPAEVQECLPYLHKQIEMIQPKLIVALGRVAGQNLLNKSAALRDMRKQRWEYRGIEMMVTYHPAAILRNMGLMDEAMSDFRKISRIYQDKK